MEITKFINFKKVLNMDYVENMLSDVVKINDDAFENKMRSLNFIAFQDIKSQEDMKLITIRHLVDFIIDNRYGLSQIMKIDMEKLYRYKIFNTNDSDGIIMVQNIKNWVNYLPLISAVTHYMSIANE